MTTANWIALVLLGIIAIRYFYFLMETWEYKQIKKRFYNGHPKAWYPPLQKPSFFKYKKHSNDYGTGKNKSHK